MPATRTRAKAKEPSEKAPSRRKPGPTRASRAGSGSGENKAVAPPARRARAPPKVHVLFNPLPTPPVTSRPAPDVYVWGKTGFGQLGLGSDVLDDILKPRKHPWVAAQIPLSTFGNEPGAGILSVAAGGMHTFLLDENGAIWSAGVNDNGALGRKSRSDSDPVSLTVLESEFGIIQTLVDQGFRAVRVVAGDSFGCALNAEGELRSWGSFREGAEGDSFFTPTVNIQWSPTPLETTGSSKIPDKISSIAAGESHILALNTAGEIYSWGAGGAGQLGRSRVLARHRGLPQKVVLGRPRDKRKAVAVGTGMRSSFAIDQDGEVWAWGANGRGQLGLGSELWGQLVEEPTKVEAVSPMVLDEGSSERVVHISGGEFHTLFLTSTGRVLACGAVDSHELGLAPDHSVFTAQDANSEPVFYENSVCVPVQVHFPSNERITSISSNMRYNMAITEHGALFSWGTGDSLGLGKDDDDNAVEVKETPTVIVRDTGPRRAVAVSSGGQHAVALLAVRDNVRSR